MCKKLPSISHTRTCKKPVNDEIDVEILDDKNKGNKKSRSSSPALTESSLNKIENIKPLIITGVNLNKKLLVQEKRAFKLQQIRKKGIARYKSAVVPETGKFDDVDMSRLSLVPKKDYRRLNFAERKQDRLAVENPTILFDQRFTPERAQRILNLYGQSRLSDSSASFRRGQIAKVVLAKDKLERSKHIDKAIKESSVLAIGERHNQSHNWALLAEMIPRVKASHKNICVVCEMPICYKGGKLDKKTTSAWVACARTAFKYLREKQKVDSGARAALLYFLAVGGVGTGASFERPDFKTVKATTDYMNRMLDPKAHSDQEKVPEDLKKLLKLDEKSSKGSTKNFIAKLSSKQSEDRTKINQMQMANERIKGLEAILENNVEMKFVDPTYGDDFENTGHLHQGLDSELRDQIKKNKYVILMSGMNHATAKTTDQYAEKKLKISSNSVNLLEKHNGVLIAADADMQEDAAQERFVADNAKGTKESSYINKIEKQKTKLVRNAMIKNAKGRWYGKPVGTLHVPSIVELSLSSSKPTVLSSPIRLYRNISKSVVEYFKHPH